MSDHNNHTHNKMDIDIDLEGIFPFEINHNTKNAFSGYKSLYFPHRTDINVDSSQYKQFEQDYEFIVENETKLIEHIRQYKKALQSQSAHIEQSNYSQIPRTSTPKPPTCASPNPSVVTTASSSTISNLSSPISSQQQLTNGYDQNKQYLDYQRYQQQLQQQQKYYNAALMQQYAANYYYGQQQMTQQQFAQYANSSYPNNYFQVL